MLVCRLSVAPIDAETCGIPRAISAALVTRRPMMKPNQNTSLPKILWGLGWFLPYRKNCYMPPSPSSRRSLCPATLANDACRLGARCSVMSMSIAR
jgi:hypothetical protein